MESNLADFKNQREIYRHQAFKMMLEIGFIIAIPAIVAFFIGRHFDTGASAKNQIYTLISLAVAFGLSWAIIIYKYIKFNKRAKAIDKKIKDLKQQDHDINDPNS
jgi:uncharacterized membrane protein YciS (DUF1049 family)